MFHRSFGGGFLETFVVFAHSPGTRTSTLLSLHECLGTTDNRSRYLAEIKIKTPVSI